MNLDTALAHAEIVFLDSVVVIYFIEAHPKYGEITQKIFERIDNGIFQVITSPITLAECLIVPQRNNDYKMLKDFIQLITAGEGVTFVSIGAAVAKQAARIRAKYNLSLPDALQLAVAIVSGCDLFLSNDKRLKQVEEICVLLLDELE